jgi:hypothetical protein
MAAERHANWYEGSLLTRDEDTEEIETDDVNAYLKATD